MQLTDWDSANNTCNAKCTDTQTVTEWPYCMFIPFTVTLLFLDLAVNIDLYICEITHLNNLVYITLLHKNLYPLRSLAIVRARKFPC